MWSTSAFVLSEVRNGRRVYDNAFASSMETVNSNASTVEEQEDDLKPSDEIQK